MPNTEFFATAREYEHPEFPEVPAIACTLPSSELQARLEWTAKLNSDALHAHHKNGLKLDLLYASDAVNRVREMVQHERQCCAFLHFTIQEECDFVRVAIEMPEAGREIAEMVFASFLAGAQS